MWFCATLLSSCAREETSTSAACDDIAKAKCTIGLGTGIAMAYLEDGPADGEAVILLHGLTDSSRSWSQVLRRLRALKPDPHVFALDQRGHGSSSMPAAENCASAPESCFQMRDFAADVVAFMQAKKLPKATLAGHSMGSFVAQEVALSHPELVNRIILVATSTKVAGNAVVRDFVLKDPIEGAWKTALEARNIAYPGGVYDLTPKSADPEVENWLAKVWDADPVADPLLLAAIVPETAKVKLGTWIGATKALLATDNTERLKSLSVPALVVWGVQDNTFFESDQLAMKEALDAAAASGKLSYHWKQYGVVPPSPSTTQNDIGHAVPWEAPNELAADIASFIANGGPTPDLYRTDSPANARGIVTDAGSAVVLHRP